MNTEKLAGAWFPLLPSARLGKRPLAASLLGRSLVLARLSGRAVCLADCCPHRHVPLSLGRVADETLQCGYHGWRFDAQGCLCSAPTRFGAEPQARVDAFACREALGWVWARLRDDAPTPAPDEAYVDFACPSGFARSDHKKTLEGDYIHAIENFLDPTHTPYIHRGLLRSEGPQVMDIAQSSHAAGFATIYRLRQRQNGWINRLFDAGIDVNEARFSFPGLVCLDYRKGERLLFRVALFFVPEAPGRVGMAARVAVPRDGLPSAVKFLLLRPFLETLARQDGRILAAQRRCHQERRAAGQAAFHSADADLVIDHLLHLLADAPAGRNKSGTMAL